jgi:hypothetical protein
MQGPEPSSAQRRWGAFGWTIIALGVALAVGLLALVAVSPVPMRGAEVFGALVNKIKGNPGATAFWVFTGLGLLWAAIAILTGIQEWRAVRRRT